MPTDIAQVGSFPQFGILFFHQPTCGPCRAQEPQLQWIEDYTQVPVFVCDAANPAHTQLVQHLQVGTTPTCVALVNGQVVNVFPGLASAQELLAAFGIHPPGPGAPQQPQNNPQRQYPG